MRRLWLTSTIGRLPALSYWENIAAGRHRVNLTNSQFDSERDAVIERAASGVICHIIAGAASPRARALALAQNYPGRHIRRRWHRECKSDRRRTLNLWRGHTVSVAIGECGLDFNRDFR